MCLWHAPMHGCPPRMAMVAGTAPWARTTASTSSAVRRFCGYGMPWLTMVLSSATTGLPSRSASATSGFTFRSAIAAAQARASCRRTARMVKARAQKLTELRAPFSSSPPCLPSACAASAAIASCCRISGCAVPIAARPPLVIRQHRAGRALRARPYSSALQPATEALRCNVARAAPPLRRRRGAHKAARGWQGAASPLSPARCRRRVSISSSNGT